MYLAMDMGTSNTRLWLCEGDRVIGGTKEGFGAKLGKTHGKAELFERLSNMIRVLLSANGAEENEIECLITAGMSQSEFGICEIPHGELPASEYILADRIVTRSIPEITGIPFWFVPGIKNTLDGQLTDIIRGEETEICGILSTLPENTPAVVVLPGTHNKIMKVDAQKRITDFCSTFSGELLDIIISYSILSSAASHNFTLSELDALRGKEYADEHGLNAAVFRVRTMEKNGESTDKMSSFLYGAVIGQDVALIQKYADNSRIYVGGNKILQAVYCALLHTCSATPLPRDLSDTATLLGLQRIYRLHSNKQKSAEILAAIKQEKVISIIRKPDMDTLEDAVGALKDGGIRLLEVTFDRSGEFPHQTTCDAISSISRTFGDSMYVGAGTVTDCKQVMMAYEAGARFIISPNCNPEIIALTKKLGLISIPAAFTPTEIAAALECGADFIKLFPADQAKKGYLKAVCAPLADAKLLAVGGVNAQNAKDFLDEGFCGIGVGSNLYNNKLIKERNFDALRELAKQFTEAVK